MEAPNPPAIVVKADQSPKPVLNRDNGQWIVLYKGRTFKMAGQSEESARAVMAAIVADVDNTAPQALPAALNARPATCGWQLINGQMRYVCPQK